MAPTKDELPAKAKWEKVLWKKQDYPDNYVDPSFLSSLRRNTTVRKYKYATLVLAACSVTQHLATIFLFVAIFILLRTNAVDARVLIWVSIAAYPLIGHPLWELMEPLPSTSDKRETRTNAVKSSILVFLILVATSPVLKTLTQATSADSVWALSACLFGLNAILADYTAAHPLAGKDRLTSVLSTNAAISASVVLASRLRSDLAVFAFILFSVQVFALFPLLRRRIQLKAHPAVQALLTIALSIASVALFSIIHIPVALLIATSLIFVTFACPAFFIWAQRFKNELKGPWDPAVPQIRRETDATFTTA